MKTIKRVASVLGCLLLVPMAVDCSSSDSEGAKSVGAQCAEFQASACGKCLEPLCTAQFDEYCSNADAEALAACQTGCETEHDKCVANCFDQQDACEDACSDASCCDTCSNTGMDCWDACPADTTDGGSYDCYTECQQAHQGGMQALAAVMQCFDANEAACAAQCNGASNVCDQ